MLDVRESVAGIIVQACEGCTPPTRRALRMASNSAVHRDVSPPNINVCGATGGR